MKIKKFVAPTMPEAMKKVRAELGKDAVILKSKEVNQGGIFGLFKKRNIEVVAALDPQPQQSKTERKSKAILKGEPKYKSIRNDDVLLEIRQLKKLIALQSVQAKHTFSPEYQVVYQHLINQEVEDDLATELIDTIENMHREMNENVSQSQILEDTEKEITNRLRRVTFQGINYKRKIIQFVGPTGVGKTTTLAKVAASCMLNDGKKVAFITADTYRIAAIEQLKTYAQILGVPVEVAYNMDDYKRAVEKFADYDVILVDTAGRNYRNKRYVEELKNSIDFEKDMETYLVLSLTAKPKDMTDIYEQFQYIPIKELIFTKADETRQYGNMLNIVLRHKKGIAYVTNGQDVPDDLIRPSAEEISKLVVGEQADA